METAKIIFCERECTLGKDARFLNTIILGRKWNFDKLNNIHFIDFTGLEREYDLPSRSNPDEEAIIARTSTVEDRSNNGTQHSADTIADVSSGLIIAADIARYI